MVVLPSLYEMQPEREFLEEQNFKALTGSGTLSTLLVRGDLGVLEGGRTERRG